LFDVVCPCCQAELKVDPKKEAHALLQAPEALLPLLKEQQAVMELLGKIKVDALASALVTPKGAAAQLARAADVSALSACMGQALARRVAGQARLPTPPLCRW